MIIPVILSGGSGSRLWPRSRASFPKQFVSLVNEDSLLANTIKRVVFDDSNLLGEEIDAPLIISNAEHRFIVASELQKQGLLGKATIILEPLAKNTCPAISVAALSAKEKFGDESILLILAADHVIRDVSEFHSVVRKGVKAARNGKLVTFGIKPDSPHTGYGYIQAEQGQAEQGVDEVYHEIIRFVEKPTQALAKQYLDSGDYYWNSGMFMFRVADFLLELQSLEPEIYKWCLASYESRREDLDFIRLEEGAFSKIPANSIDYAVMEKTKNAVTVPLDAGWSDVGSWSSLWEILPKDTSRNVISGDVIAEDVEDCLIYAGDRLVTVLGVSDQVIVETSDAILIAAKDRVEEVKKIVGTLQAKGRKEYELHKQVYRPWGSYEVMVLEDRFQVKRITVNPGQQLSIQMHHHRAEHWVVVSGTALVGRGDEQILLGEDRSTYIPLGTKHYLKNPGLIPLILIEVQTGSYLGEDDIVRFTDMYGRV
jgi:mannose-1-phosphate guanylyltransferase/mannose-6-phosphate isomerase